MSGSLDVHAGKKISRSRLRKEWHLHAGLLVMAFLTLLPFYFMVVTSLKDNYQLTASFWQPRLPFHFDNYQAAWLQIAQYLYNTCLVTVLTVLGILIVATPSAYVFARHDFPGKNVLFYLVIILMMIPGILTLVPSFMLVKTLGLLNTRAVLILPAISGGQVFAIFVLSTFMKGLPEGLFEAARIDGATVFQCFRLVALPMSKDILATISVMNIISSWNSYLWPLITVTDAHLRVITVGLQKFSGSFFMSPQYGPMFAGYVIASLPLLLLFALSGRYYIRGITSGALKI